MPHIVPVGNSFGIRIPKPILQQLGFDEETNLELKVTNEGLLISPEHRAREGWEEKFNQAQKSPLLMEELENEFDMEEWKW